MNSKAATEPAVEVIQSLLWSGFGGYCIFCYRVNFEAAV